jgi:predicted kinase
MAELYIMSGLPFAGKSTLTKALINRFGFSLVGLDEINRERGIGFHGKPVAPQEWEITYKEAYRRIGQLLSEGKSVIYDATNFTRQQRDEPKQIAQKHNACAKVIYVHVSKDEAMRRWRENRQTSNRPDVKDEDFAQVADNFQVPTEEIILLTHSQEIEPQRG